MGSELVSYQQTASFLYLAVLVDLGDNVCSDICARTMPLNFVTAILTVQDLGIQRRFIKINICNCIYRATRIFLIYGSLCGTKEW